MTNVRFKRERQMELNKNKITVCCSILLGLLATPFAQAAVIVSDPSYFTRPVLRVDGELIDGIQVNGDIESTQLQGVVGYSESTVNLADGTVKMYMEDFSGQNTLQTFGSFGERVTIKNGAGTTWDVGFALEGILEAYGGGPLNNAVNSPNIFYDVGIAVYKAGEVMWNNFVPGFNDFEALLYQHEFSIDEIDAASEYREYDLSQEVFGSVEIASDFEVYDIFTFTNVTVSTEMGDGLEEYIANFLNTASFNQTFAPGVQAFSSSGQFGGLTTPPPVIPVDVPEPESLLLFGLGLTLFARVKRNFRV